MNIKSKAQLLRALSKKGCDVTSIKRTTIPSRRGDNWLVWGYNTNVTYEGASYNVLGQTHQEVYNKVMTDIVDFEY